MKKRIPILIGLFLVIAYSHTVFAQGSEPPIPPVPTGGNVVLDTLNWLSASQTSEINALNQKLDTDGIAQIAVVTLNDCGNDKLQFRTNLFNTWGVGHKDKNDGLLILVCWYGGDPSRRSVEQVTGYGLKEKLSDEFTSGMAVEYFVPAFKENKPGDGLVAMVKGYDHFLRQVPTPSSQPVSPTSPNMNLVYFFTGVVGIFPGLMFAPAYKKIWKQRRNVTNQNSISKGMLKKRARKKSVIKTQTGMKVIYGDEDNVQEDEAQEDELQGDALLKQHIREFILAEGLSSIPILGILFGVVYLNIPGLPQIMPIYSLSIGKSLLLWLGLLAIIYALTLKKKWDFGNFGGSGGNWGSSGDGWSSDRDSFDGGRSDGGGSSTKF